MIFSELYSAYYNAVAEILSKATQNDLTEQEIRQVIIKKAFSESVVTILPALKCGKWSLLNSDLSSILHHAPTMPLTTLEKRWLRAIMEDPRVRLFDIHFPNLDDVEPLFTLDDYKIYDRYTDGDPFEDETYIAHFHLIQQAIKTKSPIKITLKSRHGKESWVRFYPQGFEYSIKDDKIRIIAAGCKFKRFNLGRVTGCYYYHGNGPWKQKPQEESVCEVTMEVVNKRNALERVMMHFAHFEKRAERIDDDRYLLHLRYYKNDETELVIRILSFGPFVKVVEPESVVGLIKERLISQKSCELP